MSRTVLYRRLALPIAALLLAACTTGLIAPVLPSPAISPTALPSVTAQPRLTPAASPRSSPRWIVPHAATPTPLSSPTPPLSPIQPTLDRPPTVLTVERGLLAPGFSLTIYS